MINLYMYYNDSAIMISIIAISMILNDYNYKHILYIIILLLNIYITL